MEFNLNEKKVLRVVLADDNEDVRRSVAEMLSQEYEVVKVVENGEQLVAAATDLHPDLLVIDVSMPVMNGLEALRRLRSAGNDAKAVMITTHSNPAYVKRAFQYGAAGFVLKAAGHEDLPRALKAAINGDIFTSAGIHRF